MTRRKWALLVVFLLLDAAIYTAQFKYGATSFLVNTLVYEWISYPATYTSGTLKYFRKGAKVRLMVDYSHSLVITDGLWPRGPSVPGYLMTEMRYADGKLTLSWGHGYLQSGEATFACKEHAAHSIEHDLTAAK